MTTARHWSILNTSFLLGTLLLALVLVPLNVMHSKHLGLELTVCLGMFAAIGLAVTAGYHRLFSHRTYQAAWPVRFVLLCFGAAAFQNSALQWSSDHRIHHRFVDTDRDPYNIRKGFWYAHWIWVMEHSPRQLQGVADLQADPLVRWQDRYHFVIGAIVACIPLFIGLATGHVWGHFVMGMLLRIVLTHHTTFLINSAAHVFGTRPYTETNSARDNGLLAPFTFGEGYHNFHHFWPGDYRNGIRWYQWDTTKWLIRSLQLIGLASKLRRTPEATIQKARIALEEKRLSRRLAEAQSSLADDLRLRLASARQRMEHALETFHAHRAERKQMRAERRQEWKQAMNQKRAELQDAWDEWKATRSMVRRAV
jgi:stearoyl-CoA desaturase (Delta-9 desaturase)